MKTASNNGSKWNWPRAKLWPKPARFPREAAAALRAHASFEVKRIDEIEREVKHDVIAFTTAVAEKMAAAGEADASRWLHYGLTSNDVVDTAQALVLQQASKLLLEGAKSLAGSLERRAWEFKDTVQIGRTHGIHAEPVTFGSEAGPLVRRTAAATFAGSKRLRKT